MTENILVRLGTFVDEVRNLHPIYVPLHHFSAWMHACMDEFVTN